MCAREARSRSCRRPGRASSTCASSARWSAWSAASASRRLSPFAARRPRAAPDGGCMSTIRCRPAARSSAPTSSASSRRGTRPSRGTPGSPPRRDASRRPISASLAIELPDCDWLICGSKSFQADAERLLIERGIAPRHIHIESFRAFDGEMPAEPVATALMSPRQRSVRRLRDAGRHRGVRRAGAARHQMAAARSPPGDAPPTAR